MVVFPLNDEFYPHNVFLDPLSAIFLVAKLLDNHLRILFADSSRGQWKLPIAERIPYFSFITKAALACLRRRAGRRIFNRPIYQNRIENSILMQHSVGKKDGSALVVFTFCFSSLVERPFELRVVISSVQQRDKNEILLSRE